LAPIALAVFLISSVSPTSAGPLEDYVDIIERIKKTKAKIAKLELEADSLAVQISFLDGQIELTQLEIDAKEAEIALLSGDIKHLSERIKAVVEFLNFQEGVFVSRARSAYTADQLSSVDIVLGSDNLEEAFRRIQYLNVLESQDREILEQMRDTRANFRKQKSSLESKRSDVEDLKRQIEEKKANLNAQRAQKAYLLDATLGEEARYQNLLKLLEAERRAIEEALRNLGTKLGPVGRGDKIAIEGSTGCSTGSHVHYEVRTAGNSQLNPCDFVSCNGIGRVVKSRVFIAPEINGILTQGYWYGHHAIDVAYGAGGVVRASAAGTAYLAQDPPWFADYCRNVLGYPYNGVGYGIVVIHNDGRKTVYWHVRKPGT
jgi:peptidoglycan hydrolase CwlO-like protein